MEAVLGPIQYALNNWETESYPQLSELRYILLFAVFFTVLRFVLDNAIFEPIGRYFIFKHARDLAKKSTSAEGRGEAGVTTPLLSKQKQGLGAANGSAAIANGSANGDTHTVASVETIDKEALEKTLYKFKESCWKSLYYTSALAMAIWASVGEPWLTDTRLYFAGPGDKVWPDQTMKLKLKTLLMFEGGFYVYSIFALIFWETRRKDFVVSMVHHVISATLAMVSFSTRLGRPASLVVAIHDTSDIFLELAKVNRYLNNEFLASVMFVLFAISWAVLRLYCYPKYILHASAFVVFKVLNKEDHRHDGPILYYAFNFILLLLQVLHIYWWILIVRVLIRQVSTAGKVEKDVRSEDEDEDGDD